jgi:hypothetical protein
MIMLLRVLLGTLVSRHRYWRYGHLRSPIAAIIHGDPLAFRPKVYVAAEYVGLGRRVLAFRDFWRLLTRLACPNRNQLCRRTIRG